MPERPLHALSLPAGPRLLHALAQALDGTGPAILPLPPDLPPPHRDTILATLRPTALDTGDGPRPYPHGLPVPATTAVVIATSGSSGQPKGVELSAAALTHSARASLNRITPPPGARWLCCLPTHHIAGLQVLTRCLLTHVEPVIHHRFDVAATMRSRAQLLALVPTQLRRLLAAEADLSAFHTILLGGAAAPPTLLRAAHARGANVITTYGMTETSGGCVYNGQPLDDVEVSVDPAGRIHLAGPPLFDRYRLAPELTARARHGRWLKTNDLGHLDDHGRLHVLGRADDIINTGGEKVAPDVVAAALASHPAVHDVAVIARPDPEWGERVTAVVVPTDPADPPRLADLRAHLRGHLPAHAVPRALELRDSLPLLPSGKLDRAALRHGQPGRHERPAPG